MFDDLLIELPGNDLIEQQELKKLIAGKPYELASGEKLEPVTAQDFYEPHSAWRYTHYLHCMPNGSGWMNETEEMLETLVEFEIAFDMLENFRQYKASKG